MQKEYEGSAYIGVVGPDTIPVQAVISIMNIARRPGDAAPHFQIATKGYEARQKCIDEFMASEHDFCLLLDHDMIFPPDTLERLRSHKLPYVSGLYMRRRFAPMIPIWFEPYTGEWPQSPFMKDPERGKLHPIGASGWGCILIHREVIEKTRPLLGGQQELLEESMHSWADSGEILRGRHDPVGSDVRYPIYALRAGYQLFGDPDVRCSHLMMYPLSPDDYSGTPESTRQEWAQKLHTEVQARRDQWKADRDA